MFRDYPAPDFLFVVALNAIPVWFLFQTLFLLFNRTLSAALGSLLLLLVFCVANGAKVKFLSLPIVPSDFQLVRTATPFLSGFIAELKLPLVLVGGLTFLCAGVVTFDLRRVPATRRWGLRLLGFGLALIPARALYLTDWDNFPYGPKLIRQAELWNKEQEYQKRGVVVGFLSELRKFQSRSRPVGYTKNAIDEIVRNHSVSTKRQPNGRSPNLIYYLMESFWDPTVLEQVGITIHPDPIPFFHSLEKKTSSGKLFVPTIGGGTVRTEFEILSALSMNFFDGDIPYNNLTGRVGALPELLRGQGYHTVAIHPYQPHSWNRHRVYPRIGFDQFITETDFPLVPRVGEYIRDEALVQRIIEESQRTKKPQFIFAITMSTHVPYLRRDFDVEFEFRYPPRANISDRQRQRFENYVKLIHAADQALLKLVRHYEMSDQETVLVVFGDHLPPVLPVLQAVHYDNVPDSAEKLKRLYSTPIALWSNFGLPREPLFLSSNFLTPHVLRRLGLSSSPVMEFVGNLQAIFQVFLPQGQILQPDVQGAPEKLIEAYQMLAYDTVWGERFALSSPTESPVNLAAFH